MPLTASDAQNALAKLASPQVAISSQRYFKTAPGEYAEGDRFLGVRIPVLRTLAKELRELSLSEIPSLIGSPIHEERMLGLLILVNSLKRSSADHQRQVYELYMANRHGVNNWDLVDTSAPAIVGGFLKEKSHQPLFELARSNILWDRRIAIVATQLWIRANLFQTTLKISKMLLNDPEDLIHKAVGWMLREIGERDQPILCTFLQSHAHDMPRTMLRSATEKLPSHLRDQLR